MTSVELLALVLESDASQSVSREKLIGESECEDYSTVSPVDLFQFVCLFLYPLFSL
jgi:hypothetical protein